ncbi:putative methyltransferase-domain-containing protein [Biscogniauxia mediterranea]|nr:putative methyltransferase-domain-containing protein [Biscogniauxia mediterranea]
MHYIRLLRPARIEEGGPYLSLLVTITTDLGDSFLCPGPDSAVDIVVSAHAAEDDDDDDEDPDNRTASPPLSLLQPPAPRFRWTPGLRVLELRARLRPHPHLPARFTVRVGCCSEEQQQVVMPVAVEMRGAACAPVALRTLPLFGEYELCFEEDIGESIARHIWDAGVVAARAFLAQGQGLGILREEKEEGEEVLRRGTGAPVNVLELGSGVGILGISIAAALERAAAAAGGGSGGDSSNTRQSTVLLTDLPEAEERARANMARADVVLTGVALTAGGDPEARPDALRATRLQYENLDWDEGRRGRFGPLVSAAAAPWDLVVLSDCTYNVDSLPALVGTLSALHGLSVTAAAGRRVDDRGEEEEDGGFKSTVLLATKPRHESEKALFGLLDAEGWRYRLWKGIPLPKMGEEDEVVEIYLLEKGGRAG